MTTDTLFIVLDIALLAMAFVTAVAVVQVRSLFASVMLAGFYSLIMALVWHNMDAPDVSFTEAAVGAGISTILLLGALVHVGRRERGGGRRIHWGALAVVVVTGGALIYGTIDMPRIGDPEAPIHTHRVPAIIGQRVGKTHPLPGEEAYWPGEYEAADHEPFSGADQTFPPGVERADGERPPYQLDDWHGHVPNTVTSLLAGYRSFDTMMETAVIFTAGMSLVLLLRRRRELRELAAEKRDEREHGGGPP